MKVGEIMPLDREIVLNEGETLSHAYSRQYRRQAGTGRLSFSFF